MANEIFNSEYVTQYERKALDTIYALESASSVFSGGYQVVPLDFENSRTVKIKKIAVSGLYNYTEANLEGYTGADGHMHFNGGDQPDGYRRGSVVQGWEEFRLQWNRGVQIPIPYAPMQWMGGIDTVVGQTSGELVRTQVVPEIDTLIFGYIADRVRDGGGAALGNYVLEDLTSSSKILEEFNNAFAALTENGVPDTDQVIIVTPTLLGYIRNSSELVKYLDVRSEGRDGFNTKITTFNGHEIRVCPSNRFFTDAVAGEGGVFSTANSKSINFIIADRRAIGSYRMVQRVQVFDRSVVQDFDGYKINYHLVHGVWIPDNKIPGVFVSVSNSLGAKSKRTVVPFLATGENANGYVVTGYQTNPAGTAGDLYFSDTQVNIGGAAPSQKVTIGKEIIDDTNSKGYFALVDKNTKKIINVSGQVNLPRKGA